MGVQNSLLDKFVRFANVDLDKASPGERLNIVWDLGLALSGLVFETDEAFVDQLTETVGSPVHMFESDRPRGLEKLRRAQKGLRIFLEDLADKIEQARKLSGIPLSMDQFAVASKVSQLDTTVQVEAHIVAPITYAYNEDLEPESALWEKKSLGEEAIFRVGETPNNITDAIEYHFLKALDGLPISTLKKCPVCSNWFVNLSRRTKEYCSNRCASKEINRRKHEKLKEADPDHYQERLEEMKDIAHENYKRKQLKKNPNAKVQRRPQKRKSQED